MRVEDHILDIAESLFNLHGYTAVGIDLIRDEARVSKTTIYRHFDGKGGLIRSVLNRRHLRFRKTLTSVLDPITNTDDKLIAILDWHFNWFDSSDFEGCMFMHAFSEFKEEDKKISQIALDHKTWLSQVLLSTLDVNTVAREQKAEMLMTILVGMIVRAEFSTLSNDRQMYKTLMLNIAGCKYKIGE
ncbi:MAG: TetR/AcrR family transcriptional regulator [Arenicella sp.]|nr:TetR/AcrR family transcriptional regulator [Arenicella sp.]